MIFSAGRRTSPTCVARDIFGKQTHITYIDLCEQLQQVLDIKERTAKSYIRFMREREIILKDPANQSYFMIEKIDRLLNSQNCLDGEKLLDNQDLCFMLKVSVKTLQRYRKKGILPYLLLDGKYYYRASDIHKLIRERTD